MRNRAATFGQKADVVLVDPDGVNNHGALVEDAHFMDVAHERLSELLLP